MNYEKSMKRQLDLEYELVSDFIKLRQELGLSQREMSKECGVIREIIANIETRKKHPQINTLIKILEPFGYTIGIKKIEGDSSE